jgi:two-component system, NtrC family, response regulator HydG
MQAHLIVVEGEGAPRTYGLNPDTPITIGRSRNNGVVLGDDKASRVHATVYFENGAWYVRDNHTLNGTFLAGVRLAEPLVLADGVEFTIAKVKLRFSLSENGVLDFQECPTPDRDFSTSWLAEELATLHSFMANSAGTNEARDVIVCALETILRQTKATLVGFMSMGQDENLLPRVILPESARVDMGLSKNLVASVQREDRTIWLKTARPGQLESSESLLAFDDAACIPLKAEGAPFAALHVYRCGGSFSERQIRFSEIVASNLANFLSRLRRFRSLEAENVRLKQRALVSDDLVGESEAIAQLRVLIQKAAACPSTVLIHGETGSGKELVATAIHRNSGRRGGPLLAVNCGAIAPTLLEAELFGYVQGAFTGADRAHRGYFEQADEGTLFLDEIGDMSLDCQVKVLRVLDKMTFKPVGGVKDITVDVRVIAASHKDLASEMQAGRFRKDLYYRLRVISVNVPPLREHLEDLEALATRFLDKFKAETGRVKLLTPPALERLRSYSWPGNVRELRTVLESAFMLTDGSEIDAVDLWLQGAPLPDQPPSLKISDLEAWAIREALKRTKGNISAAARMVDLSRETLNQKMKKFGISKDDF